MRGSRQPCWTQTENVGQLLEAFIVISIKSGSGHTDEILSAGKRSHQKCWEVIDTVADYMRFEALFIGIGGSSCKRMKEANFPKLQLLISFI